MILYKETFNASVILVMVEMEKLYFADLFSGTGGFSKGFCNYSEKYELAFAIDILKVAAQTTKANHMRLRRHFQKFLYKMI
jgi:site-specific DNA-cytosine methylase